MYTPASTDKFAETVESTSVPTYDILRTTYTCVSTYQICRNHARLETCSHLEIVPKKLKKNVIIVTIFNMY